MLTQNTYTEYQNVARDSRKVVFIGEDSQMLRVLTLSVHLRWPDVSPVQAADAEEGMELVGRVSPDMIVVGTRHPDLAPPAVVEELRSFSGAPIVVLSREDDEIEAVTSLELGADDYIRFPCGMMEIMARMWASLRRVGSVVSHSENGRPINSGDLLLNPATYEAFMGKRKVALTVTEFRMLHLLAKNRGTVVSHQCMEEKLWGERTFNPQVAKKYIQRLRYKLGDSATEPNWIANVHGVGYRFIGPKPHAQGAIA